MLFQLIGVKTYTESELGGYEGKRRFLRSIVALFSSRKKALQYVENSKLKNVSVWDNIQFKKKSLLSGCEFAEVVQVTALPCDPQLRKAK